MTKKEIRNQILGIRKGLQQDEVINVSKAICSHITKQGYLNDISDICLYMPIKNEIDLADLVSICREQQINIWLPRIINKTMDFYKYDEDTTLIQGAYNILEPNSEKILTPNEHTLVIVPGSVFSIKGDRIGYGGGYYDRYMMQYPFCTYLAVCYDFQIVPEIPTEEHDQKPDIILSEQRIISTT